MNDEETKVTEEIVKNINASSDKFKELVWKKFKIKLDNSEEALETVDDLITLFFKEHKSHHYQAVVLIGSFLGSVIINNLGGKWQKDLTIRKIGKLKVTINTMQRAQKRLSGGLSEALVNYYRNLKINTCFDASFAIKREFIEQAKERLRKDKWDDKLYERMTSEGEAKYIREEAADILGKIAGRNIVPKLINDLKDPKNSYYAAIVLQRLPDKDAFLPLMELLTKTKSTMAKMQAILALGELRDARAVDTLIELLGSENEIICHCISIALGKVGGDNALKKLMDILANLRAGHRIYAIAALEGMGDKRATPALIETLFSKDEEIKEASARAFQFIPDKRAFKPLLYALKDPSKKIKVLAAYSLAHIDCEEALPYIKELLKDDTEMVRNHISRLLKFIEQCEKPLVKCV